MALTNFIPRQTLVTAEWLNEVDRFVQSGDSPQGYSVTKVVDAITAVNATGLGLVDGDVVVAKGRTTAGDGGAVVGGYTYDADSSATVNNGTVFAPTAGPGRLIARTGTDAPSPAWFGDIAAANSTATWQAYFDYCRDTNQAWIVPPGSFTVSSVTAYTGGLCLGEFVGINDSALGPVVTIAPVASDITAIPVATLNAWTGLVRGTEKSADWTSYYGQTISMISSDEDVINRLSLSGVFYRESFVVHDPDGSIYPPISTTKTVTWTAGNTTAVAVVNRDPITITGLRARINATGAGERNAVIKITRPNTILIGAGQKSDNAAAVQQGFLGQYCSGLTFIRCTVEGLLDVNTQYGFNFDSCCDIALTDCSESNCRRGVDGTGVKNLRIRGGSYPDGIGTHWGVDCSADGLAYLSSDPSNTAPAWWAGEDFSVTNSNIVLRPDQYIVMGLRSDIFEARGKWHLAGNTITIDCTANTGTARYLSDFTAGISAGSHDWGRLIYMPDSIRITNNRIRQTGAGFSNYLYPVRMFGNAPTPPLGISAGGQLDISGNSFDMAAGVLNGVQPRMLLQLNKQTCWTEGAGYRIRATDLPAIWVLLFCAAAHPTPSTSRSVFSGDNIGSLRWSVNFGAWIKGAFDCQAMTNDFGSGRPGGGYATPIGDEIESRTTQLYAVLNPWAPGLILDGAFAGVNVTVPGCAVGDVGIASLTGLTADGWHFDARCITDGTMRVTLFNDTGGPLTPSSGTLRVKVLKF